MLAGSRPKVLYNSWAAAFAVEIWAHLCQMTRTVWENNFGTFASRKTRMAPKPSKVTTARWLASSWKNIPLAMKCQINNVKARSSPTQT